MSILSEPHFYNEAAAIARLEAIVWPNGLYCPRCSGFDRTAFKGGRAGLRRWGKREFTVTVGTLSERSHIKLHLWFGVEGREIGAAEDKSAADELLGRLAKMPPEPRIKPKPK